MVRAIAEGDGMRGKQPRVARAIAPAGHGSPKSEGVLRLTSP